MAKGRLRVANTEGQFDWKPIESDPVSERIFFIICGKEPNIVASNTKPTSEKRDKVADNVDGIKVGKDTTRVKIILLIYYSRRICCLP